MSTILNVQMLGEFVLQYGENRIDNQRNRIKKVWLQLAYNIFTRDTRPSQTH